MTLITSDTLLDIKENADDMLDGIIGELVASTPLAHKMFYTKILTDFRPALLQIGWSWRRTDITQQALALTTITTNCQNWGSTALPKGLPEQMTLSWRGTVYTVPLMHSRAANLALYMEGNLFHVPQSTA